MCGPENKKARDEPRPARSIIPWMGTGSPLGAGGHDSFDFWTSSLAMLAGTSA
jgi:hypothetical protein